MSAKATPIHEAACLVEYFILKLSIKLDPTIALEITAQMRGFESLDQMQKAGSPDRPFREEGLDKALMAHGFNLTPEHITLLTIELHQTTLDANDENPSSDLLQRELEAFAQKAPTQTKLKNWVQLSEIVRKVRIHLEKRALAGEPEPEFLFGNILRLKLLENGGVYDIDLAANDPSGWEVDASGSPAGLAHDGEGVPYTQETLSDEFAEFYIEEDGLRHQVIAFKLLQAARTIKKLKPGQKLEDNLSIIAADPWRFTLTVKTESGSQGIYPRITEETPV